MRCTEEQPSIILSEWKEEIREYVSSSTSLLFNNNVYTIAKVEIFQVEKNKRMRKLLNHDRTMSLLITQSESCALRYDERGGMEKKK